MKNILVYSGVAVSRKRIRFGVIVSVESLPFAKFCDEAELQATLDEAAVAGGRSEVIAVNLDRLSAAELARIWHLGRMAEFGIEVDPVEEFEEAI